MTPTAGSLGVYKRCTLSFIFSLAFSSFVTFTPKHRTIPDSCSRLPHYQRHEEIMKFLLSSTAVLPFLIVVLPSVVEAQFMQFVRISSETTYFESTRANTLSLSVLIGGTLSESISGGNQCISGCDNKFCSKDGVICAKVFENCEGNSDFNIYYANTCRQFTLKDGSECGSDPDPEGGKQSWKDTYIPWQDFDFQSGASC